MSVPGRQGGLHTLLQRAGGGRFIQVVLWSGERPQKAHWKQLTFKNKSTMYTQNISPRNPFLFLSKALDTTAYQLPEGLPLTLNVGCGVIVLHHQELAPVLQGQHQQALHHL